MARAVSEGLAGTWQQNKEQILTFENLDHFLILTSFTAYPMNGSPGDDKGMSQKTEAP